MTTRIADPGVIYQAVYDLIDAVMPFTIGDHEQPDPPALALYSLDGGEVEGTDMGSLGEPDVDLTMAFQVNCLSRRRDQVQWMQREVRFLLLSQDIVIPGRAVFRVMLTDPSGVSRDDTLGEQYGRLFYTTDGFDIKTVPE